MVELPSPWPHQERADQEIKAAIASGDRRICVAAPTGARKTYIMLRLILWAREQGWNVVLYTHRRMLREQIEKLLIEFEIPYGIRAAGEDPKLSLPVQISMIQTEESRVYKLTRWSLHRANLVLVDEAHQQGGPTAEKIFADHEAMGAAIVGFTGTPLEIGHIYRTLIVAAKNSELRKCGAHVPCHTFGPDEPDTRHIKRQKSGEFSEKDVRKVIMTSTIFARVYDWWAKLNPDARPAILFAPGVAESIWFAEQFHAKGVRAAHIDGNECWIDGRSYKSSRDAREGIIGGVKDGSIRIVCNRFVLREGIDIPELYHGIFATVFGALTSYLQAGGRLLRSHPSLDRVILQDHGGNWWRHGSLNADREWRLEYTNNIASGLREERLREKREPEPIVCPQCGGVRNFGPICPTCGHEHSKRSRMVVQKDGSLKEMTGDIYKPRRVAQRPDTERIWTECYFRAKNSKNGMTFSQAEALFFMENHYYPPRTLPLMPKDEITWFSKVKDIPREELIPREQTADV